MVACQSLSGFRWVRNDSRYMCNSCGAIKEVSACKMDKDRVKIKVRTPNSQDHWQGGLPLMSWHVQCIIPAFVTWCPHDWVWQPHPPQSGMCCLWFQPGFWPWPMRWQVVPTHWGQVQSGLISAACGGQGGCNGVNPIGPHADVWIGLSSGMDCDSLVDSQKVETDVSDYGWLRRWVENKHERPWPTACKVISEC